ncbi:MAG: dihydroneopterin aldolase [Chloroflexi bacterium]|nr:dihydroneopterin aldolase [Chloroflexota bacterium]
MSDRTTDRILIEGLRVSCVIGVNEPERTAKQDVVLDIALHADVRTAGRSDDIADTVDYGVLARSVAEHVAGSSFKLVEALAESVADVCLADARVTRVDVRIRKPGALRPADSAGVEISRRHG